MNSKCPLFVVYLHIYTETGVFLHLERKNNNEIGIAFYVFLSGPKHSIHSTRVIIIHMKYTMLFSQDVGICCRVESVLLRDSPRFYTNILRTSMILLVDFTVILASASLTFRLCCLRTKRPTKTVSAVFGFYLRESII